MRKTADVRSIDALKDARAALAEFRESAGVSLSEAQSDIQRTIWWLQNDRRTFWQHELRRREEKVNQARTDLYRAKLAAMDADTTNSYTAALGESISIMGPSLYDAPGYGVGTSGSSGRMPGRGSSSDDLHFHESAGRVDVHSMHSERSGGGTGETAAQRRTPADFTQVFSKVNPLEGIRARITKPFRGFGSKNYDGLHQL